ncbi:MAG: LamG-like jellyroll fold domain-containing protein, partial [Terriglobales bacterium]
ADLYAASDGKPDLTVIAAAGQRPLLTMSLPNPVTALAASPDGNRVFAGSVDGGGVREIETSTRRMVTIEVDGGVNGIAVSPDGGTLYLAQRYDGLSSVNLATRAVRHLMTSACPSALAMAPDGRTLYVAYQCGGPGGRPGYDTIGVFDVALQRFTSTIGGRDPMVGIAIRVTPDGSQLWASAGDACISPAYNHAGCPPGAGGIVYIYSTASGQRLNRIVLGSGAVESIVFLEGGTRALLDNKIVDTTRLEVLEALPMPAGRSAMSPDGERLYVPLTGKDAVAVFTTPQANCAPPLRELVAWWPGDGSAADSWSVHAGQNRGVGYAPARVGQGFVFGARSQLDFGHDLALARDWHAGGAVAAWVKFANAAPGVILQKQSPDGGLGWRLARGQRGQIEACWAGTPRCLASAPLGAGAWHYLALSASAKRATLFVDGQAVAQAPIPANASAPAADLLAGAPDAAHAGFQGMLDELVMYARVLSPQDLQSLMAMPQCVQGHLPQARDP